MSRASKTKKKVLNAFMKIPNEVFVEIFLFLDKKSILELYRVNSRIKEILFSDIFNQLMCRSLWPTHEELPKYIFEKFHNNSKRHQFLSGNKFRFTSYAITFTTLLENPTEIRTANGKYFTSSLPGSEITNKFQLPDIEKLFLNSFKYSQKDIEEMKEMKNKITLEEAMDENSRFKDISFFPYCVYKRFESVSLDGKIESKYPCLHYIYTHAGDEHEYECVLDEDYKPIYGVFMGNHDFDNVEWNSEKEEKKYGMSLALVIRIFCSLMCTFDDDEEMKVSFCKPLYSYVIDEDYLDFMEDEDIIEENSFQGFIDGFDREI